MKLRPAPEDTIDRLGEVIDLPGKPGDTVPTNAFAGRRLEIRTLQNLNAEIETDYIVKQWMLPGDMSVIYGRSTSGKTFITLWLGYHAAQGRTVFGQRTRETQVLYVVLEGERGFERRVRVISDRLGSTKNFSWTAQPVNLLDTNGDLLSLIDAINTTGAKLVIIDTYARAMRGGDENDARDTGLMISAGDEIRHRTGAHVCFVSHAGKDATRGIRGHSSLMAAMDFVGEVQRTEGDVRTFRIDKAKDGIDGIEFGFQLDVIELGYDDDMDMVTTCVVREVSNDKTQPTPTLTKGELSWFNDLLALFNEVGVGETIIPASGLTQQFCLTREQVREGFKRRGRLTPKPDGTLTQSDRQKVSTALIALRDKGKIGITDKHVWVLSPCQ
jgi:hypothetical protein